MGNVTHCCESDTGKDEIQGIAPKPFAGLKSGAAGDANPILEEAYPSGGGKDSAARDIRAPFAQDVKYDDGSTYEGQVIEGRRQGRGVWKFAQGQYEGQWKDDMQHGSGIQTWSDGRVYDGEFAGGHFSGRGKMTWHTPGGSLLYEGQYLDDQKHGEGSFRWADGRAFHGQWNEGKRHGKGTYVNSRAEEKLGWWSDDKFERWCES